MMKCWEVAAQLTDAQHERLVAKVMELYSQPFGVLAIHRAVNGLLVQVQLHNGLRQTVVLGDQ